MTAHGGPNIVEDGLVLYLDAANVDSYASGSTTWKDLSGNGNNGTLTNGPTFDSGSLGSISFDGVDDVYPIGSLGFAGFTQLTINVWYYSNVNSSTALVRSSDISNAFILHYRGFGFYLRANDNTVSGYLEWQTTVPFNQWMMLTGTWNGSTMKLYQNSTKQVNERSFTGGSNGILATINTVQLGYYFNSTQPWTNGKIASCALYNKALTDTEIQQNYNATKSRFGL